MRSPDATDQVAAFMDALPQWPEMPTRAIVEAVDYVAEVGPAARRPIMAEVNLVPGYPAAAAEFGHHLREIRPLGTTVRILAAFAPDRTLVLLHAGDKGGEWTAWYRAAIPAAAAAWRAYLRDLGL